MRLKMKQIDSQNKTVFPAQFLKIRRFSQNETNVYISHVVTIYSYLLEIGEMSGLPAGLRSLKEISRPYIPRLIATHPPELERSSSGGATLRLRLR